MNHQITKRCVSFPNLITDLLTKHSMFDRNKFVGHLSLTRASSVRINTSASTVAGILASLAWDDEATGNFVRVANSIYTMYYAAARTSPECSCQRSLFTDG